MPLTHVSMRAGKPPAYRQAVFDAIHRAMRETYDVPAGNHFMTLTEHDAANFRFGPSFLDIERSEHLVYIQATVNNTRTVEQKKALYRRLVDLLAENPGIRPEDVFINLVEVNKENWSLGRGLAQYA